MPAFETHPQDPHPGLPTLLRGLLDDAAVFPPGNASLPDAVRNHRHYRQAWYAELVGPLLVPASQVLRLPGLLRPGERIEVGVIADTGVGAAFADAPERVVVRQVEAAVAKRGEDPLPGIARMVDLLDGRDLRGYAEIPLSLGLLAGLDAVAEARDGGVPLAAKFRTGGLAAELFPTPIELAAVIQSCVDRKVPFKLTAGLHHAIRHTDPETGFHHHGFLNVLAATCAADGGAEVADVAGLLATTQPLTLIEAVRLRRHEPRPYWIGFGTCSIPEPLADLRQLGLLGDAPDVPDQPEERA